jgi:hypothetical protein
MPFWPTLLCVNLWLIALVVPLTLTAGRPAPFTVVAAVLALPAWALGLRYRRLGIGQFALLLGVPLLLLLPGAGESLSDPRLSPRLAVLLELSLFLGYVTSVCRLLVLSAPAPSAFLFRQPAPAAGAPSARNPWKATPYAPPAPADSQSALLDASRLRRRIVVHRLLIAYAVTLPALLLYAIDLHPAHVRALRASFGSLRHVAAIQATLTAGMALLYSLVFYFCIRAPLGSYLDHHVKLRGELRRVRRQARRGRPRAYLYLFMVGVLLGMISLIAWSLRR